jgi:hypothetical protein
MPKTGSSSIQESLFHGLRDPRFRYLALGLVNASRPIQVLFADQPVAAHTHRAQGVSAQAMQNRKEFFSECFERQIRKAKQEKATPILSAEDCWFLSAQELARLREKIHSFGFIPHVVAYLRSPLAWMTSMYQELLKSGHHQFADHLLLGSDEAPPITATMGCNYLPHLEKFEAVFGKENLLVRSFRHQDLVDGCVVSDFCKSLGIDFPKGRVQRFNESLSLETSRFLYAVNRFVREQEAIPFRKILLLLRRLNEYPGKPLRLDPGILEPYAENLALQLDPIRKSYHVDMEEDWRAIGQSNVDPTRLTSERDMLVFSEDSLHWLAKSLKIAPPQTTDSERLAERVAMQVMQLRPRFQHRLQDYLQGKRRERILRSIILDLQTK